MSRGTPGKSAVAMLMVAGGVGAAIPVSTAESAQPQPARTRFNCNAIRPTGKANYSSPLDRPAPKKNSNPGRRDRKIPITFAR
jgi:hypothetical protein